MLRTRPLVFVLTDGSANRGFAVSDHSRKVLTERGIAIGSVFGAYPDRVFYEHIRKLDFSFFRGLASLLSEELADESVETVAGDAIEGFNPTHDLCRLIINAGILVANSRRKTPLKNLDFALDGPVFDPAHIGRTDLVTMKLSKDETDEKIRVARGYPGIQSDIDRAIKAFGEHTFAEECLRPTGLERLYQQLHDQKPAYERYGEERVRDGLYSFVIRYTEHLQPIQKDLASWTDEAISNGRK